jgi:hypothetical protein
MVEGINMRQEVNPTLEELDGVSGREIEGILERPEKFMPLQEGVDFTIAQKNEHVVSDRKLQDFIVFISPSTGTETKVVEAPHWRAVNDNNVHSSVHLDAHEDRPALTDYFYGVSTKGVGYLKPTAKGIDIEGYDTWTVDDKEGVNDRGYKVLGLISREEALGGDLVKSSEQILKMGIRTELYWGMAEIHRLPFRGEMLTVDQLRDRGITSPRQSYKPYEVVRLFKMNNRIAEVADSDERRAELFKKAFEVFNKETHDKGLNFPELQIGNPEHEQIFFREFFRRMGKNMALFFNNGLEHGYMHSANVTLAAEIADVGTMDSWTNQQDESKLTKYGGVRWGSLKDMRDMCYGLRMLYKAAKKANLDFGGKPGLSDAFFEGFNETLDEEMLEVEDTDFKNARKWMKKIFNTVIIKGGNLPSLIHHEVEDWDISVG